MSARVPPNELDAEAAILSATLLQDDAVDRVAAVLRPEHFYADRNGKIYQAVIDIRAQGKPPDAVSVATLLRDRGILGQIGGTPYLAQLADATPSVANLEHHAEIVREKWRVRRAITICQEGAAVGYAPIEDTDAYLRKLEEDLGQLSMLRSAVTLEPVGQVLHRTIEAMASDKTQGRSTAGLPTGYTLLDQIIGGLFPTDLYILAARPGLGKTSLMTNIAANVARPRRGETGDAVALFSLEMGREQLALRIACQEAEVDATRVRNSQLSREDWGKLLPAAQLLKQMPIFVDDTPAITLFDVRTRVRKLKRDLASGNAGYKANLGLVAIDYLQLMRGEVSRNGTREQEVASLSRGLKSLAKEEGVPVLALSQLNRQVERQTKDKRPGLADLRESGAIEQDADTVIFIYRESYYDKTAPNRGETEVIIAKQRNGSTGYVTLFFKEVYTRYYNLESNWEHTDDDWQNGN